MLHRIEINTLCGGLAFGSMCFEDGTVIPLQMPVSSYYDLCAKGFFTLPANIPERGKAEQEGNEALNFSEVMYTEETLTIDRMESASGERVF